MAKVNFGYASHRIQQRDRVWGELRYSKGNLEEIQPKVGPGEPEIALERLAVEIALAEAVLLLSAEVAALREARVNAD